MALQAILNLIGFLKESSTKNLLFNIFGKSMAVLCSFLFTPYFIAILGIEYYGLISFSATLVTIFSLLDLGISQVLIKELSKNHALKIPFAETVNFLRNFELLYWCGGLFFLLLLTLLAPMLAFHWLHSDSITPEKFVYCLKLLALTILFQWTTPFYSGVLLASNQQGILNATLSIAAIIKNLGLVIYFYFFNPSIEAFFIGNLIVNVLQTTIFFICVNKKYPYLKERFSLKLNTILNLKTTFADIAGISLLSIFLMNIDKIILSKMLDLEIYGKYCLAASIASILPIISAAFFQTFFPKFSALVALKQTEQLEMLYLKSARLLSLSIIPAALMIFFYAKELIYFWTANEMLARDVAPILKVLVIATSINGIMMMPYIAQLSYNRLKPLFWQCFISTILSIPSIFIAIRLWGPVGAAWGTTFTYLFYLLVNVPLMHKVILKSLKMRWYFIHIVPSFSAAILLFFYRRAFSHSNIYLLILIYFAVCCFFAATLSIYKKISRKLLRI